MSADTEETIPQLREEMRQLLIKVKKIEDDPKNRNPPGTFQIYTASARRRMDKFMWSITHCRARIRALEGHPVPTNGYSGRNSNRR